MAPPLANYRDPHHEMLQSPNRSLILACQNRALFLTTSQTKVVKCNHRPPCASTFVVTKHLENTLTCRHTRPTITLGGSFSHKPMLLHPKNKAFDQHRYKLLSHAKNTTEGANHFFFAPPQGWPSDHHVTSIPPPSISHDYVGYNIFLICYA